jgi:hypothetical protein
MGPPWCPPDGAPLLSLGALLTYGPICPGYQSSQNLFAAGTGDQPQLHGARASAIGDVVGDSQAPRSLQDDMPLEDSAGWQLHMPGFPPVDMHQGSASPSDGDGNGTDIAAVAAGTVPFGIVNGARRAMSRADERLLRRREINRNSQRRIRQRRQIETDALKEQVGGTGRQRGAVQETWERMR